MSKFKNMKTEGIEKSQDRLGSFQVYESGIYAGKIKAMYAGESQGGAQNMTVELDLGGGKTYRQTIYFTSSAEKGGHHYYVNKQTGKKEPLPGFTVVNDLCLIATGKELSEQDVEEKTINVYNFESGKEEPTGVDMLVDCIGQEVAVGLLKQVEDKRKKNDNTGEYEPTGETRETNEIDKVFHPELKVTVNEGLEGKPAEFWDAWLKKNEGKVRDRTQKTSSSGGRGAMPPKPSGSAPAAKPSLFGKK